MPITVLGMITVSRGKKKLLFKQFVEISSLIKMLLPRNEVFPVTSIILCHIMKIILQVFSVN